MGCKKLAYYGQEALGDITKKMKVVQGKKGVRQKKCINYYPFGMLQPGRSYSSNSYRYGFQGQEKDDEIKGDGNSINYKYRMHDARLGRFLSLDPLSASYPHNSPYAFSENRVIDGVELEGLEFYFAADGSLIGKFGYSNEMRVVNDDELADATSALNNPSSVHRGYLEQYLPNMGSKVFSNASESSQKNVTKKLYSKAYKGNLSSVTVNLSDNGTAMSVPNSTTDLTIYPNLTKNNESILNDYYNFMNILSHEKEHMLGVAGEGFSHFDIAKRQLKHSTYINMTENGQSYVQGMMSGYLHDMTSYLSKELHYAKSDEAAISKYNSYSFQYYLEKYQSAVSYYNDTFGTKRIPYDFEKISNRGNTKIEESEK